MKGLHWPTILAALLSPNGFFARWQTQIPVTSALAAPIYLAMLRPAYLSQKLDRPLPTKDGGMDCSPSLDQVAGLFPASSGQRGPYATDRSISSIGALLPIALCGLSSL